MYSKLHRLSFNAERMMRGEFDIQLEEKTEGEVSILGFQMNQMAKRLKLTLEELQNERNNLKSWISDISHQLKTPLSVIKMLNDLMLEGAGEEKETREEFLKQNVEQINQMEWLIKNLLKISKLEAGAVNFYKEEQDLSETVLETMETFKIKFKEKNLNVSFNKIGQEFVLPHDREWLEEAFKNVIDNAVKYTLEGGSISFLIERTDYLIKVSIKDSGVGIEKDEISHIFDRFYSRGKSGVGTGIGLPLSKLIVEKHGGIIKVQSSVGVGTEFSIIFRV
jgi:signal transduction histidine kinase